MHALPAQPNIQPNRSSDGVIGVSPARVARLDEELRDRLVRSFDHIAEVYASRGGQALDGVSALKARLRAGPVSPWVFGLYAKLVAELSRREADTAVLTFGDVVQAAALPPSCGLIALRDGAIAPSWWDHYCRLLDTDRERSFGFHAPRPQDAASCRLEIESTLALVKPADPELYEELTSLLRMIVLGGSDSTNGFDGASTFFFWGAILLNAGLRRDAMNTLDLLVHESSHVQLFGLSAAGPLTKNDGRERYASALRDDPRPIEGIYHAGFVSTRVHMAMTRLLDSGHLSAAEQGSAAERRAFNGAAAQASLDSVAQHAVLTELGDRIYAELRDYWSVN